MAKTGVMLKLDESQLAALDVLCLHGSRAAYFQNLIPSLAKQRAGIEELAIQGFRLAARAAHDDRDHERAAEYNRLIAEADANLDILRRV